MRKANELREYLASAYPFFRDQPDRLLVFVDGGQVIGTGTLNLSHEYRYTLTLVVTDFPGEADALMVPLLAWLRVNQPELMANPDRRASAIEFDVELLNHNTCDIEVKVPLTERVIVRPGDSPGALKVEHVGEPLDPALTPAATRYPVTLPSGAEISITLPAERNPYA